MLRNVSKADIFGYVFILCCCSVSEFSLMFMYIYVYIYICYLRFLRLLCVKIIIYTMDTCIFVRIMFRIRCK